LRRCDPCAHLKVELGVAFSQVGFPVADGAKLIAEYGRRRLLRDDWLQVFEPESVTDQVQTILRHELSPPPEGRR